MLNSILALVKLALRYKNKPSIWWVVFFILFAMTIKDKMPNVLNLRFTGSSSDSSVTITGDNNQLTLSQDPTPSFSPGVHISNATFMESRPEIYGAYPYIMVDGNAQLNLTSSGSTYHGKNTALHVQGSSTVDFSSTNDEFGK